jgi:hypothetical protein
MGMATVAAGVLGKTPVAFAQSNEVGGSGIADNEVSPALNGRVQHALNLRIAAAQRDSRIPVPPHTTNGDEQRYLDHSASYSKGLLQDDIGVVNRAAWRSFKKALGSGRNSDFEAIIMGGAHTLNGPQGSYAFDLETADSEQFGNAPWIGDPGGLPLVPPFAQIESTDYGTQLVEMYWAHSCAMWPSPTTPQTPPPSQPQQSLQPCQPTMARETATEM